MIALEAHAEGTILAVRAHAKARRNAIERERAGSLVVSVTAAPEKGKANKAIVGLLAETLSLRKNQFELLSGETAPQKRFLIRGVSPDELRNRIEQAITPG